ncbi:GtrA family protein [Microbacterium sp.]|uniref:GtrA family protein n=1 Tax=Microbacterium sp. TaxID=51671 RepID=UPI0039E423B2
MHVVLIPAYEPDERLVDLVRALVADGPVLVVDDGSGPDFAGVFAAAASLGAVVLTQPHNRGKGAALRTGFAHVARVWPGSAVVTADADGQHTPADIRRVAAAVEGPAHAEAAAQRKALAVVAASGSATPRQLPSERVMTPQSPRGRPAIVLGARTFSGDLSPRVPLQIPLRIPLRSRVGNEATRWAFQLATGQRLRDTQTGLRGYPAEILPWLLSLPGDRFEYEFTMLLRARAAGIELVELPIQTVYLDGNRSSHFRPLVDSLRVYGPLLRFAASALFAFAIDTVALLVLNALTGWLLFSVVAARLISGTVNFAVNRTVVFRDGRDLPTRTTALRYFSLAGLLLAANYGILSALTDAGVPMLLAKIATETTLFVVSYSVQRAVVFPSAQARE